MQIHGASRGASTTDGSFALWLQQEWHRWGRLEWHRHSQLRQLGSSAEDLAQDLAIVALMIRSRLEPMVVPARRAYMRSVALHLIERRMQSLRNPISLDEAPEVADRTSAEDKSGGSLDMQGVRILDALQRLSPLQRNAMHMRYVLKLNARDAAARLGTTSQTVDTAVAKAKLRLSASIRT